MEQLHYLYPAAKNYFDMHTHRFHWFWNISISKEIIITSSTTKIIVIIVIIIITTLEAIRQTSSSIQRKSYHLAGSPVFILLRSLNSMTFFINLFQFSMSLSLAVILKKLLNSLVFMYFFPLHVSSRDKRYGFHQNGCCFLLVLALTFLVTNLPITTLIFYDFPGLVKEILKFYNFLGFP